jgi:anti-sigma factor RsiW
MTDTTDTNDTNDTNADAAELSDDELAMLSDYHDKLLSAEAARSVEAKISNDPRWREANVEFEATKEALSGLQKARAPVNFATDVTETIAKRSGGAFFGKSYFGERIPFAALLVVAIVVIGLLAALLWSSTTGSASRRRTGTDGNLPSTTQLPQP